MDDKKLYIIIGVACVIIAVLGAVSFGAITAYTSYNDTNIKLDVPQGTEFQINPTNASLNYISTNPKLNISVASIDPNNSYANETYSKFKGDILNKLSKKKMNNSDHNYNGTIYNMSNNTSNKTVYSIVLFNDTSYSIVVLSSENLNTVIKMGETFELMKPYIIKLPEVSNQKNSVNNGNNSYLALALLYGYIMGYYDGSSSYDDYYDDSYYDDYYDDSDYDDDYEDDSYDDYDYYDYDYYDDDYYYDDYSYDDYYY